MKHRPDLRSIATNFRSVGHFGESLFSRGTKEVHNTHTVQKGRNRKRIKRSLDERSEEPRVLGFFGESPFWYEYLLRNFVE